MAFKLDAVVSSVSQGCKILSEQILDCSHCKINKNGFNFVHKWCKSVQKLGFIYWFWCEETKEINTEIFHQQCFQETTDHKKNFKK